jgi:hypothetical protein
MLPRLKKTACAALIAVVVCLAAAGSASAHDSLQPPGTLHGWLPNEEWVMQHWVPFDETRLYAALRTDNVALERWLRDDHRTIADLATWRGIDPDALADHLAEPWRDAVSPEQFSVLRERTGRMLTQGHLAQHVLFHYFHGTNLASRTQAVLGFDYASFVALRAQGLTILEVARRGGRSPAQAAAGVRAALVDGAALGVARAEQSPSQSAFMLHRRTALLQCFLRRPLAKYDRTNPYGEHLGGHGEHPRGSRIGLLPDSQQRRARHRAHCCWHEPPQS